MLIDFELCAVGSKRVVTVRRLVFIASARATKNGTVHKEWNNF